MVRLSVKALCLSAVALVSAKSPLLAWTNKNVADISSVNYANADDVANLLAPFLETCPQSVLILDQPKFDIGELKEMRAVKSAFEAAKSAIQVGHFDTEDVNNVDTIVNAIAEKCSNTIVSEDKVGESDSIVIKKLSGILTESQKIIKNLLKKVNDNTLVVFVSNNNVNAQKLLVQRQLTPVTGENAQPTDQQNTQSTDQQNTQPTDQQNTQSTEQQNNQQNDQQNTQGNAQATNSTVVANEETATFGKYVFFNKAVFEGIIGMTPIILIALIGVSWLISVQTPTRFSTKKKDN
ncbi:hypothetical protein PIROE2DRAFT_61214 [Piromyces sp. E2]|nr:hypothetical protein PIROE2DRAFT_61214 [Piromyces sp. E2]|eukprot:OUM63532.1 hypothetical protein PIROE2DRAFT_61214 [Piromyces sp. E2]